MTKNIEIKENEKEGVDIAVYINWILTALLIAVLFYGIYNGYIFQPTCDCTASYDEVCGLIREGAREINNLSIWLP